MESEYLDSLLEKTAKVAEEAGNGLVLFQKQVKEITKEEKYFLTTADLSSDEVIFKGLEKLAPEIPIYSEENNRGLEVGNKILWVVDPLDGTINYFHQDVFFGVTIALVESGKVLLSVINLPALGQLLAVTTKGTSFIKGEISLGVDHQTDLAKAQIWTDWNKKNKEHTLSVFNKLAAITRPQIRRCSSAAYLAVATGKISGFILPTAPPEDFLAGSLIVEKAGGRVSVLQNGFIVASNAVLHEQLLEVLNRDL